MMDVPTIDRILQALADLTDGGQVRWHLEQSRSDGRSVGFVRGYQAAGHIFVCPMIALANLVPDEFSPHEVFNSSLGRSIMDAADDRADCNREIRERLLEACGLAPKGLGRLGRLADFLETQVPESRLNMGHWQSGDLVNQCGTTGCACGWATTIPEFREAGFTMADWGEVAYRRVLGYHGASLFFDISYEESLMLFSPTSYPREDETPIDEVVRRIRDFVAQKRSPGQ
jgi:hypothetical protein